MRAFIYEYKDESERTDYLSDNHLSLLNYECASDGNIYVSTNGVYDETKKIDDVINELLSVKEGIKSLREKYGANKFLELDEQHKKLIEMGIFDVQCGELYDIPFHDYQKVVTWQETVKPKNG